MSIWGPRGQQVRDSLTASELRELDHERTSAGRRRELVRLAKSRLEPSR